MSQEPGKEPNTERDDAPVSSEGGGEQFKILIGRIAALVGLIVVLLSTLFMFLAGSAAGASISGEVIALALGAVGYALGARKIGLAALVLGVLGVLLSLAAASGLVPGIPEGTQNLFQGPPGDPEP